MGLADYLQRRLRMPAQGMPGIPQRDTLAQTGELVMRAFDQYCEIVRLGAGSPAFGQAVPQIQRLGRYPCSVGERRASGAETPLPAGGVEQSLEVEIALPAGVLVEAKDRIALPGWCGEWQPDTHYSLLAGIQTVLVWRVGFTGGTTPMFALRAAGVSGAVEPQWDERHDAATVDGECLWVMVGTAVVYEVVAPQSGLSNFMQLLVRAKSLD